MYTCTHPHTYPHTHTYPPYTVRADYNMLAHTYNTHKRHPHMHTTHTHTHTNCKISIPSAHHLELPRRGEDHAAVGPQLLCILVIVLLRANSGTHVNTNRKERASSSSSSSSTITKTIWRRIRKPTSGFCPSGGASDWTRFRSSAISFESRAACRGERERVCVCVLCDRVRGE